MSNLLPKEEKVFTYLDFQHRTNRINVELMVIFFYKMKHLSHAEFDEIIQVIQNKQLSWDRWDDTVVQSWTAY